MRQLLVTLAVLLLCAPATATTLQGLDADQLLEQSELVFTGTAIDRQVATSRDGSYPFTFITFAVDTVVKGQVEDNLLTLRFEGGEIGEEFIEVLGIPTFERDAEYLLFVADNGLAISPIVGWTHGQFELLQHPSLPGEKVIVDRIGQAVEGLGEGKFLRTRVERDGRSVKRARGGLGGVTVLEEDNVVITDPEAPSLDKLGQDLVPASTVLNSLKARATARASDKSFRPGAIVRSLTLDDVPETFTLREGATNARKEAN